MWTYFNLKISQWFKLLNCTLKYVENDMIMLGVWQNLFFQRNDGGWWVDIFFKMKIVEWQWWMSKKMMGNVEG